MLSYCTIYRLQSILIQLFKFNTSPKFSYDALVQGLSEKKCCELRFYFLSIELGHSLKIFRIISQQWINFQLITLPL